MIRIYVLMPDSPHTDMPHTDTPVPRQPQVSLTAGLWRDNPAFVQLLGLCPLLAVSNSMVNGLALALATGAVMIASSVAVSTLRQLIPDAVRLPILVLVVATFTSAVVMVLEAWAMPLYLALALFIQIIVTNCAILARLEACARHVPVHAALRDATGRALGFGWVLVLLGAVRELLAEGRVACGAERLFGDHATRWCADIDGPGTTFLLAATPAGAFLTLGLLLAARNLLQHKGNNDVQPVRILTADPPAAPPRQP